MTLPAIPPSIRVTETTCTNRSPSNSRGSYGTSASAAMPAAARWIALSASHGRAEWPLVPGKVHVALMFPRQPAWIAFAVGSMTITASAPRRPGSRSSSGPSALWTMGSSSRPKKTYPTSTFARAPRSLRASSTITATAPFMSAAPRPWTASPLRRPGRLSCAGTVSRWPARRTSGRSPRPVVPARTQVSPASRPPTSRSTSSTSAARSDSLRDSDGTSMSSRARAARRSASDDIGARTLRRPRDDARRRARRERVREIAGLDAAQVRVVEVDRDRARVVEAERGAAVRDELAPQVAGRGEQGVARLALAARAGLELAHLLERVDAHLRVAADRQAHASVAVAHCGEEAVAEVALGRRARDDDRARLGQHVDVGVGDVDAVDHARARPEEAAAQQQRDRRAAVLGFALVELAALLVGVDVERQAVLGRVRGDGRQPRRRDRADAVRRHADGDPVAPGRPRPQRV